MIFYLLCILFGYLIQRVNKSNWAYLLSPVGAFLASLLGIVFAYLFALITGKEIGGKDVLIGVALEASLGSLFVAFALWYFRKKNTQALVLMICFGFYALIVPTFIFSMEKDFRFLSDPQIRAKIFYSSLYSMCGALLASLVLLIYGSSKKNGFYGVIAFLLFSFSPLAVRFLDSNLKITHGAFTSFWIQVNTLSYASMLFLTIPVSIVLTYVIWKSDIQAQKQCIDVSRPVEPRTET